MGKRKKGWRRFAVLISHYTSTPRDCVDRYPTRQAEAEMDAIAAVMKMLERRRHF
jgi:hypothetical protein